MKYFAVKVGSWTEHMLKSLFSRIAHNRDKIQDFIIEYGGSAYHYINSSENISGIDGVKFNEPREGWVKLEKNPEYYRPTDEVLINKMKDLSIPKTELGRLFKSDESYTPHVEKGRFSYLVKVSPQAISDGLVDMSDEEEFTEITMSDFIYNRGM